MKKKLLTGLGCLALAVVGAFGLVGCGESKPVVHTVSFGAVEGYFRGNTVSVAATEWEKLTKEAEENAQDEHFDEYKAVYKLTTTELQQVGPNTKAAFGSDYVVCITFAGKGYKIPDAVVKAQAETYPQDWDELADSNEDAQPVETDLHVFIGVPGTGKSTAKTVFLSIDWDGEGKEEAEIYKLIIPQDITLSPTQASEAV